MHYHFQRGTVEVPDHYNDRTMHVLVPAGAGFTFIISQDELEPGESPEAFVQRQLGDLARQVTKFEETAREAIFLGPPEQGVQGLRIEFRYRQRGSFSYQCQGIFPLSDRKTLLTFTASAAAPFDAPQLQLWRQMVASVALRR